MAFQNPFNKIASIDDETYLKVDVKRFLKLEPQTESFYSAIEKLSNVRETLIVAEEAKLITPLAEVARLYKLALAWLKLNTPINEIVGVPAIASYDEINEPLAQSFNQYVTNFRANYLETAPVYIAIQSQRGIKKLKAVTAADDIVEKLEEDFKAALKNSQSEFAVTIDQRRQDLSDELSSQFNQQTQQIYSARDEVLGQIQQAQALSIWNESYSDNIALYQKRLTGIEWRDLGFKSGASELSEILNIEFVVLRSFLRAGLKTSLRSLIPTAWSFIKAIVTFLISLLKTILKVIFRFSNWVLSKSILSARGQRFLWFFILGIVLVGQSVLFTHLLLNGSIQDIPVINLINLGNLDNLLGNEFLFAKISIFVGFILVPSLGYAFANRNYRIYSNLLEQYRHRATVAQTLQGILRNISESEENKDIRTSLATVAAVAMFEMKNVGHLTKRDGDTLPVAEILQGVLKK